MYVGLELFEDAVPVLAAAIEASEIRLGAGPDGQANIVSWERAAWEKRATEAGIEAQAFSEAWDDVEDALSAAAIGISDDLFVSVRSEPRKNQDAEEAEVAAAKYALVKETFDVPSLARQAWNKRTSKIPTFRTVNWETVTKHTDDDLEAPDGPELSIGQLEVVVKRPAAARSEEERVTFAVDRLDVDILLAALERLREELEKP